MIKDINYYFKQIGTFKSGRPRMAVDYDKLLSTDFNFFLIITERETRVKTYGAKKMIFEDWKKNQRLNTLWLRTRADDIRPEKIKFFSDIPAEMRPFNFEFEGMVAYSRDEETKEKTPFLMINSLTGTGAVRGSRVLCDFIIYDEFNLGVDAKNYASISTNFADLLRSTSNSETAKSQKVFLLGNNRTFNSPILVDLGVTSIKEEVTAIYSESGQPIMLILFPILSEQEIEDIANENSDNAQFQFLKKLGTVEHSFYNQSQFDDINGIVEYREYLEPIIHNGNRKFFRVGDKILMACNVKGYLKQNEIHWFMLNELMEELGSSFERVKNEGLVSSRVDKPIPNDIIITKDLQKVLLKELALDMYTFENITTKDLFYKLLK